MGQTMITGAFFVLLIFSVMNANRMISESNQSTYEGEAANLAVDVARSIIDEAQRKQFDLSVVPNTYQPASDFTSSSSLGPAYYESISPWPDVAPFKSISTYNDIDDYNGYSRTVDLGGISGFVATVQVYYVNPSTLSKTTARTYLKCISVTVTHSQYLEDGVTFTSMVTL